MHHQLEPVVPSAHGGRLATPRLMLSKRRRPSQRQGHPRTTLRSQYGCTPFNASPTCAIRSANLHPKRERVRGRPEDELPVRPHRDASAAALVAPPADARARSGLLAARCLPHPVAPLFARYAQLRRGHKRRRGNSTEQDGTRRTIRLVRFSLSSSPPCESSCSIIIFPSPGPIAVRCAALHRQYAGHSPAPPP